METDVNIADAKLNILSPERPFLKNNDLTPVKEVNNLIKKKVDPITNLLTSLGSDPLAFLKLKKQI